MDVFLKPSIWGTNSTHCAMHNGIDKNSDPCISYCVLNMQMMTPVSRCIQSSGLENMSFDKRYVN